MLAHNQTYLKGGGFLFFPLPFLLSLPPLPSPSLPIPSPPIPFPPLSFPPFPLKVGALKNHPGYGPGMYNLGVLDGIVQ